MNLSARLPDTPFLRDTGTDSMCDFGRFRGGWFGPFLQALAIQFHDDFVSGATIEPVAYINSEVRNGTFAAFRIPTSNIAVEYWQALKYPPNGNMADAMLDSADVLCVAGSSGSWAIWGERMVGIAIVRTVGFDVTWRGDSDWFLEPTDAIHALAEPNFERLPSEFGQKFLRNARPFGGYEEE
jgi:hypothetical protein